jgi:hypothetical protein
MRAASCTASDKTPLLPPFLPVLPPCSSKRVSFHQTHPTPQDSCAFRQTPKVIVHASVAQAVPQSHVPALARHCTCVPWPRLEPQCHTMLAECSHARAVHHLAEGSASVPQPRRPTQYCRVRVGETPDRMTHTHTQADGADRHTLHLPRVQHAHGRSVLASAGHKPCRTGMTRVRRHATLHACHPHAPGFCLLQHTHPVSTQHRQTSLMGVGMRRARVVLWSATQKRGTVIEAVHRLPRGRADQLGGQISPCQL